MTTLKLMAGAEPFYFPGGPTGCLLIHGFTGMPYEMRGVADHLVAQGYSVLGPRLTHHGAQAADMNRSHWRDWYLAALDGWHLLRGQCRQVVPIGLSMGGATALLLAANEPVAGVVAVNTPLQLPPDWRLRIVRPLSRIIRFVAKPREEGEQPLVPSYPVFPLRALAQLVDYFRVVDQALPRITAPALIMQARGDSSVPRENLDQISGRIGANAQKRWIERGEHIVTEDEGKEELYSALTAFLAGLE